MRRIVVWLLWGVASLSGMYQIMRLSLVPVSMILSAQNGEPWAAQRGYWLGGLIVSVILLVVYGFPGFALYTSSIGTFWPGAGVHIVFSILSLPGVGHPILPGSGLLLLASLPCIRFPERRSLPQRANRP